MSRYGDDENYVGNGATRQRDLVLSTNEFCFIQSKTNGQMKTYTGPIMVTISQQENLVTFNPKTKKFEETSDFEKAKQLFISAPEGWYLALKNPAIDNQHPEGGKANNSPELEIGKKINVAGPASFALYPGQMAKVVQGHRLRSNQYLLARVYDADAAQKSAATIVDAEGKEVKSTEKYFAGQLLVIKGTEVSFYIPPTGIEVIPVGGKNDNGYVRDAVTLERLEYAILKDEDGEKRYIHGPSVVFPKPTETFVTTPKGGNIFRALELSPISGIYVKVISAYKDDNGVEHPVGEEMFITGKDQMIYYPRPELAMIEYDGKYMHHAIAIPEGEGRYVLNRLTGEIKTVKGPAMYLPDPRTEVIVKRKLTRKECDLLYPGNTEVIDYNNSLSERAVEQMAKKGLTTNSAVTNALNCSYSTANQEKSLAIFELNAAISRGASYTKPRTICLDTKYDGVVSVDVWTGFAINVVSKTGKREVVIGPTTRLLDYDETVESMQLSTGKPKTTDKLLTTAFLRIANNKISDVINLQTKDYVDVQVKVSYCVDFLDEFKDKWFSIDNYVKFLCDRGRSVLKKEAKKYTIQEFYQNSTDIVRKTLLGITDNKEKDKKYNGKLFKENGMLISDVEVLSVGVESKIAEMLEEHQVEIIQKTLELSDAEAKMKVITALAENDRKEADLVNANQLYKLELAQKLAKEKLAKDEELAKEKRVSEAASYQARADLQNVIKVINDAELERQKADQDAKIAYEKEKAAIEKAKQEVYAETVKKIVESISPDLVAALSTKANEELLAEATKNMSAISIAKGESVADTINTLLRGTTLENVINKVTENK